MRLRAGRGVVALVLTGLALVSAPVAAVAAWSSDGPGATTARAGTLGTPSVSASAVSCRALRQTSTLSWAAVTGASGYDVDVSTNGSFPGTVRSQSATSVTLAAGDQGTGLGGGTYSVRVRASAGNWTGPWSATTAVTLRLCVA